MFDQENSDVYPISIENYVVWDGVQAVEKFNEVHRQIDLDLDLDFEKS